MYGTPTAIEGVTILGVMALTIWWYCRAPGVTAFGGGLFTTIALGLYVAGLVQHDGNMLGLRAVSLLTAAGQRVRSRP